MDILRDGLTGHQLTQQWWMIKGIEEQIRLMACQLFMRMVPGGDGYYPGSDVASTTDVERRIANDPGAFRGEGASVVFTGRPPGCLGHFIAGEQAVAKPSEGKVVIDAIVAELDLGSPANVAGQQADEDRFGNCSEFIE